MLYRGLHIPTRLFKQAVNLSKQARAIKAALDGINPPNAGKRGQQVKISYNCVGVHELPDTTEADSKTA